MSLILKYYDISFDMESIHHNYCLDGHDIDPGTMIRVLRKMGLKARRTKVRRHRINKTPMPCIGVLENGDYMILAATNEDEILIQKKGVPPFKMSNDELFQEWAGDCILTTYRHKLKKDFSQFGIQWFIPVLVKYRHLLRDVIVASFFIQLFALLTPLIFQIIMDKVLVHRAELTLNLLVITLFCTSLFEVILDLLRTYVLSHTTNRIDVELGSRIFQHLMNLPIGFFDKRPVGQIVARVHELDNIRDFLTSSALTLIIDIFFSLVFIGVLFLYSEKLAWIVVASIPFYVLISILITPELRNKTEAKFQRGALNHSFLTEAMTGMETLKSLSVEPRFRKRWEEQLAGYVAASFRVVMLGTAGSQLVALVNKMITILLTWQGAQEVINGHLSVGELIAFNMLSGQISAPILRLAQLWQNFQQFRISIERLGDVINTPPETKSTLTQSPPSDVVSDIRFEDICFRYEPGSPEVIADLSFHIPKGQIVGITGPSGSGKSTISKLVQRLYLPERGKIFFGSHNIALINPTWLRKRIGVVPQESLLFSDSIRANIALTQPASDMDTIVHAARMAGCHEFITRLPMGYDTQLGERGTGLSGGQRQRISIARALLTNPHVLILDEATSALDYESESIIQKNMSEIAKDRTVLVIAHRLSTIVHCDRILMIDHGQIIEDGSHQELISKGGAYARLWQSQMKEE